MLTMHRPSGLKGMHVYLFSPYNFHAVLQTRVLTDESKSGVLVYGLLVACPSLAEFMIIFEICGTLQFR